MSKRLTLKRIKEEVRKVTGCQDEDSEEFKAGVCMLAALQVGANADAVSKFTGYPRSLTREFGHRLRDNGVWKRGTTNADWFGKDGGIEFCCDVNVALGRMQRAAA
jgi:hypothetical protein